MESLKQLEEQYERMEEALQNIAVWGQAYPLKVFPEPTKEEWARAAEVLKAVGITLDRISASNMRYVVTGVGNIAREALEPPTTHKETT